MKKLTNTNRGSFIVIEEEYKIIIDETYPNVVYIGKSRVGANELDSVWQIKQIYVDGYLTKILWAAGSKRFEYVWNERYILQYF